MKEIEQIIILYLQKFELMNEDERKTLLGVIKELALPKVIVQRNDIDPGIFRAVEKEYIDKQ